MNFEDFKKEREIWSKIETQEQLDKCQADFEKFLLSEEDKNYFEPIKEKEFDLNYIGDFYRNELYKKFNHRNLTEGEIKILIIPSFEPESHLTFKFDSNIFFVSLQQIEENLWSCIYDQKNIQKIKVKNYQVKFSSNIGKKLFGLFDSIFLEARNPKVGMMVLDGVEFQMSKIYQNKIVSIKTNPCEGDYKTTKICKLLELIKDILLKNIDIESTETNKLIDQLNMHST